MPTPPIDSLLTIVKAWAQAQKNLYALALVGSYARGTARPDSDIDFILLTPSPDSFRHATTWPYEIAWLQAGLRLVKWHDRTYGAVWSRHLLFDTGLQVEMSFGALSWASVTPLDSGTRRVIADGCRILYDPEQLLATLLHVIHPNE